MDSAAEGCTEVQGFLFRPPRSNGCLRRTPNIAPWHKHFDQCAGATELIMKRANEWR